MAEDGRIGGEPMDMVDNEPMPNVPFDINDLEVVDWLGFLWWFVWWK